MMHAARLIAALLIPLAAAADSPPRIAVLYELSGRQAAFGAECAQGVAVAKAIHPNVRAELLAGDSMEPSAAAISEIRKMAEAQGAVAALALGTGICMPLRKMVKQLRLPLLCLSSHPDLLRNNRYVHRFLISTVEEGEALAALMLQVPGRRVGFITVEDEYSVSLSAHVRRAFERQGGEVLVDEVVLPGESDFTGVAAKVLKSGVSAVFVNGGESDLPPLLHKLHEQGGVKRLFSNIRIRAQGVVEAVDPAAAEGLQFIDVDAEQPFFTKRLRELYPGAAPTSISYSCYAAASAVLQARERAEEPVDRDAMQQALHKLEEIKLLDGTLPLVDREAQFMPAAKVIRRGAVWTLPKSS